MLDVAELAPDVPRPLYRLEFERLCELGAFDDERVELLEGGSTARVRSSGRSHFRTSWCE